MDYIVCGGFPAAVQYGALELSQYREDCITLADTGYTTDYQVDVEQRGGNGDYAWNSWTAALYVQYRRIFDQYSGKTIWVSPVYHAIERHLYVDGALI